MSWAFTVHEYHPGSRLLLCANNLLHISHLKGFIFRWTLFIWECRSSDMVNFLSHCEQGKRGPSSHLWCCFLWRTRFLFCTYDFLHTGQRCRSTGTYFCGVEVINGWPVVSTSILAGTPIALPSVTADISICNMESSDLISNLSGMTLWFSGSEHGMAQHWNSHFSGSEHRKNRRVFSYPSITTSKYS